LTDQNNGRARIKSVGFRRQCAKLYMLRASNRPSRKLARSADIKHARPVFAFEESLQLRGIESVEHGGAKARPQV
jgi:hypothetical protein